MTTKKSVQGKTKGKVAVKIRQLPTGVPGLDEILGVQRFVRRRETAAVEQIQEECLQNIVSVMAQDDG